MPLVPDHILRAMPTLGSQHHLVDPFVYARLVVPDTPRSWYLTEASPDRNDYHCFGYVVIDEDHWGFQHFSLDDLVQTWGERIQYDQSFVPGPFIDSVLAPWYDDA